MVVNCLYFTELAGCIKKEFEGIWITTVLPARFDWVFDFGYHSSDRDSHKDIRIRFFHFFISL